MADFLQQRVHVPPAAVFGLLVSTRNPTCDPTDMAQRHDALRPCTMSGLPKADMAENCAAASRPGSARAHASDDNSGKSFRINIDLGCGPSPAYGPLHGTCSALLPAVRAMAKIMQGPQNTKRP